jgi:competence protein ComEC
MSPLVMRITFKNTAALLEADAEKQSEQRISLEQPTADLLKVAHHGSATSTLPLLLEAVYPQFAVISVGARNSYGHPRQEVLGRLAQAHVATYRTDLNGAVSFYLDGQQSQRSSAGSSVISISAVSSLGARRYS